MGTQSKTRSKSVRLAYFDGPELLLGEDDGKPINLDPKRSIPDQLALKCPRGTKAQPGDDLNDERGHKDLQNASKALK